MNYGTLVAQIAATFNIPNWESASRVDFNISELELDANNLTPAQAAEIERCIAADLKAGK